MYQKGGGGGIGKEMCWATVGGQLEESNKEHISVSERDRMAGDTHTHTICAGRHCEACHRLFIHSSTYWLPSVPVTMSRRTVKTSLPAEGVATVVCEAPTVGACTCGSLFRASRPAGENLTKCTSGTTLIFRHKKGTTSVSDPD